jgi:hypothetical protein
MLLMKVTMQLCEPNTYIDVENLIDYAINEDVSYTNQPTELRNQRVHTIRVS